MSIITFALGIQLPWAIILLPRPMLFSVQMPRLIAAVPMMALMVIQLFAAVLLYRKRVSGWWLAVGLILLLSASNMTNLLVYGSRYYEQALGADVSAEISKSPIGSAKSHLIMQCVWILTMLAGAIWVKRCCLSDMEDHNEQATIGSASLLL